MLKKYASWILGASLALVLAAPIAHAKHWVLLGTAHVDKNEDHKTIHVGNGAGEFRNGGISPHMIRMHMRVDDVA